MTVQIKMLTLGMVATNCYIIGDTGTGDALVIDPVDDAPTILRAAQESSWTIRRILATHGHFDHVLGSRELKALTGAPFAIHADDLPYLHALPQTGLRFTGQPFPEAAEPDEFLTTEPQTLQLGAIRLETRFTPGHTPGHIAFVMPAQQIVFSGDALFAGSIGRTDLPGGDYNRLIRSIREQLLTLDDAMRVLSGHGEPTTIGAERRTNPFLQG
jgi:glyoxylase-like metal-dependent hydrolase (beta-lactamase superfamily II)